MKTIIITTLAAFTVMTSYGAEPYPDAVEYLKAGRYEVAKNLLLRESSSVQREYNLGEAYSALGQTDSAIYYYNQALKLVPNYALALLGKARIELKSSPAKAEEQIREILKGGDKKDVAIWVAAAKAV